MNEFKFLDYCTKYSSKGDYYKELSKCYCFGDIFNSDLSKDTDNTYSIYLNTDLNKASNNHIANYCFFDKRQIANHLKQAKDIYPFEFSIKKEDEEYIVNLHVHDVPGTFHKYILTWTRYLYEYPFNVALLDAYKLKASDSRFKFTSIINLINLILSSIPEISVHQMNDSGIYDFYTKSQIRKSISCNHRVNKIFNITNNSILSLNKNSSIKPDLDKFDLDYWLDEEIFNKERKSIYLKIYNKLKK